MDIDNIPIVIPKKTETVVIRFNCKSNKLRIKIF